MTIIFTTYSDSLLDKKVTFSGKTVDCKNCACLQLEDNQVVYIPSISSWDDDYYGKTIIISGLFQKKKIIPDVKIDGNGAISQGAFGSQHILEDIDRLEIVNE
ncbi:MAG TPA: hypothetical protein VMZ29_16900 [Candidatus Bathyarchaeia archaeon]|nr:hypothetical protein [Candidatus Bathyarchaeia archaeon]